MFQQFLNPPSPKSVNNYFRRKRFKFIQSLLDSIDKPLTILDVGGTEAYWQSMGFTGTDDISIVLLNLTKVPSVSKGFSSVTGNACNLSEYPDNHFDIVFSNSVIEHLFTFDNQMLMADEVRRVGKNYLIQTPNRYFPLEPHWLFPMYQFLPFKLKLFLTSRFSLGNYPKEPDLQVAEQRVREVRLMTKREMKLLFPDGLLYKEKALGLTKSLTMYKFS